MIYPNVKNFWLQDNGDTFELVLLDTGKKFHQFFFGYDDWVAFRSEIQSPTQKEMAEIGAEYSPHYQE